MKESKKKTNYFLNSCSPIIEKGVAESIHKKTFEKIELNKDISILPPPAKTGKKTRLWVSVLSGSVAAAILLLAVFSIKHTKEEPNFMDIVSLTENQVYENNSDEVVLILSDSRQVVFSQDELIAFTSDGVLDYPITTSGDKKDDATQESLNQLLVPKGKSSQLLLSDGTKVWVNAGSRIFFPKVFSKEKRNIYIDGEAYLEVAHNADRPFHVTANGFDIKVLGTSFNVFAYKNDDMKEVALVSGKIEITDQQNQVLEMKPDELVSFAQNSILEKKQVDAKNYTSWINKILILQGETLTAITHRLALTYGVEIHCDSSIGKEEMFGKLDLNNDIKEILNYLELMLPISVTQEEGTFSLRQK
ncbi:FecR family protein [Massilibacteroides vaginae]|uniref:FecR family protein n=1 Tax=Massilibacteroides vaginae TaxID=1673718 RepID=UPI000A1C81AF|nr:FecR family protein [Massilibacteroides vaginae]